MGVVKSVPVKSIPVKPLKPHPVRTTTVMLEKSHDTVQAAGYDMSVDYRSKTVSARWSGSSWANHSHNVQWDGYENSWQEGLRDNILVYIPSVQIEYSALSQLEVTEVFTTEDREFVILGVPINGHEHNFTIIMKPYQLQGLDSNHLNLMTLLSLTKLVQSTSFTFSVIHAHLPLLFKQLQQCNSLYWVRLVSGKGSGTYAERVDQASLWVELLKFWWLQLISIFPV